MAFPLATEKATTIYVDSDTDQIWQARSSIKTNFDNVNSIIDEFDLSSPTQQGVLGHNGSQFTTIYPAQDHNMVYLTFSNFSDGNSDDGISNVTIENTNHQTGITISDPDSAGRTMMNFPAGDYYFQQVNAFGTPGQGRASTFFYWIQPGYDSAGTILGGNADEHDDEYGAVDRIQIIGTQFVTSGTNPGIRFLAYSGNQSFTSLDDIDSAGEEGSTSRMNRELFSFATDTSLYLRSQIAYEGGATVNPVAHPDIIIRRLV